MEEVSVKHFQIIKVAIGKLVISDDNMRRRSQPDTKLKQMSKSIETEGVICPPVVKAHSDPQMRKDGFYEVICGGRRLDALEALVREGNRGYTSETEIDCQLHQNGDLVRLSLAENLVRLTPKPIEVYEALNRMTQDGYGVKDIALSLGVKNEYVRAFLQIGRVHPEIREAAHEQNLSLTLLSAFASSPDTEAQLKCFEAHGAAADPQAVREELSGKTRGADDPSVRYAGLDQYREQGGTLSHNLFSHGDEGDVSKATVDNPALVEEMVSQKLQAEGRRIADETGIQDTEICNTPADYEMARSLYREPQGDEPQDQLVNLVSYDDEGQTVSETRVRSETPLSKALQEDPTSEADDSPQTGPGGDPRPWKPALLEGLHHLRAAHLDDAIRRAASKGTRESIHTALRLWTAAGLQALSQPRPGPGAEAESPVQLYASHWKVLERSGSTPIDAVFTDHPTGTPAPERPDVLPMTFAEWLAHLEDLPPAELAQLAGAAFGRLLTGGGVAGGDTAMALARASQLNFSRSWKPHMGNATDFGKPAKKDFTSYFHELPKRSIRRMAEAMAGAQAGESIEAIPSRDQAAEFMTACFRIAEEGRNGQAFTEADTIRAEHDLPETVLTDLAAAAKDFAPPGFAPDEALAETENGA